MTFTKKNGCIKMIVFHWFSPWSVLLLPINEIWESTTMNCFFFFIKNIYIRFSSASNLIFKNFSLFFLLSQIIGKQPLLRITYDLPDKVHYNKVWYSILVWSLVWKIAKLTHKPKLMETVFNQETDYSLTSMSYTI